MNSTENNSENPFFTHEVNKICGVCHDTLENTIHSWMLKIVPGEEPIETYKVLQSVSKFKLAENGPQFLCSTCFEQVTIVYKFQQQCNKSQNYFEDFLKQSKARAVVPSKRKLEITHNQPQEESLLVKVPEEQEETLCPTSTIKIELVESEECSPSSSTHRNGDQANIWKMIDDGPTSGSFEQIVLRNDAGITMGLELEDSADEYEEVDEIGALGRKMRLKSEDRYERRYVHFKKWMDAHAVQAVNEPVLIEYFKYLATVYKPSSLMPVFSMLKGSLKAIHDVDIATFAKTKAMLIKHGKTYSPPKRVVFTLEQTNSFLAYAPDYDYLLMKVVLIMCACGGCRKVDLTKFLKKDVVDGNTTFRVKFFPEDAIKARHFTVDEQYYSTVKKYILLRPDRCTNPRFFLSYKRGQYTNSVVGKNWFGDVPKKIAGYLKLPNATSYRMTAMKKLAKKQS